MKRFGFILAGVSALMLMASCEKEVNAPATAGEYALVSVSVSPSVITRAEAGDGTQATDLYAVVYNQEGTELKDLRQHIASAVYPQSVEFKLVKEQTYKIVFLAQSTGAYLSGDAWDMKAITLPAGKLNSDEQDLFTAVKSVTVQEVNQSESVTLTRPFAQVNFACSDESLAAAIAAGFNPAKVKLSFKDLPETYNAVEGTVSGTRATVEYAEAEPYNHAFKAGYKTMAYAYLPVGADSYNTDATLVINDGARNISVSNLPIKANYRTNVLGDFFTSAVKYSVTIDGEFTNAVDVEIVTPWDGTSTEEVTPDTTDPNVFEISTADELAWVAEQVNSNPSNTFSGKTVKLVKDIDLNNKNWTPIGLTGDVSGFQGVFDGNGKTISNLFINLTATPKYQSAGLFGSLNGTLKNLTISNATVKNLTTGSATSCGTAVAVGSSQYQSTIENVTVLNATVEANRYAGGIAGYAKSTITGCIVDGLNIVLTPDKLTGSYDNGDKAGGILGQDNSGGSTITGNTVKNFTIKGYRDLGGIVGNAYLQTSTVTGNTASDGTITVDQTTNSYGNKAANAAAIVGRVSNGTYDASTSANTVENVSVSQIVAEGLTKDGEGNYHASTAAAVMNAQSHASAAGATSAVIYLENGTYDLNGKLFSIKNLEFIGEGDNTIIDLGNGLNTNPSVNVDLHFKDLVLKSSNENYKGFQHANSAIYDNVTIYGRRTLYELTAVFNDCTFIQNAYDYSFWTYGANVVTFNNCTFDSAGKALKVYKENDTVLRVVNVNNCTFKADRSRAGKSSVKAAIEIDSNHCSFEVNIVNSTAEGFDNGENSGLTLYNYDLVSGGAKPTNLTVTIDGVEQSL